MGKISWYVAVFLLGLSSMSARAAELSAPDFQTILCNYRKADWTAEGRMYFRGNGEYWLQYMSSDTLPQRKAVVLIKKVAPAKDGGCKRTVVSYLRLPDELLDLTPTFDCHLMKEQQYMPDEIWFGYVSKNKGYGIHQPIIAWKITTFKDDKSSFVKFDGKNTEDILCTVLP